MIEYLVTTRLEKVQEYQGKGYQVLMLDGTVPGFVPREGIDFVFDHHREGGSPVQILEMGDCPRPTENEKWVIVTPLLDADAIVAAVFALLSPEDRSKALLSNVFSDKKLLAIAYDCDHLTVPPNLFHLGKFAANCVAALKGESEKLIPEGFPASRRDWSLDQKDEFNSLAFEHGVNWLINAFIGFQAYPGENGEADAYWEKQGQYVSQILSEKRVRVYKDALIFDAKGMGGAYVDPRCWLRATAQMGIDPNEITPATLTQREVFIGGEFKGYSYTLAVFPLHRAVLAVDYTQGTFQALTKAEKEIDPNSEGWGGRKTVGGSGRNTVSNLSPEQVIDIVTL